MSNGAGEVSDGVPCDPRSRWPKLDNNKVWPCCRSRLKLVYPLSSAMRAFDVVLLYTFSLSCCATHCLLWTRSTAVCFGVDVTTMLNRIGPGIEQEV